MHSPKLVAFDLDGTLAESKQRMSADMGERLSALLFQVPVAILSGAKFEQFTDQCLTALPPEAQLGQLYIFPDNAAQCFVYRGGVWHPQYDHSFSRDEADHITQTLESTLKEMSFPEPKQLWGVQIENRGAQISFSPLGQSAPLDAKEDWREANDHLRHQLRALLAQRLPDYSVSTGGMTTIDITRKGITKAYGLRRLAGLAHTPIEDMVYVGDALEEDGNDSIVLETGVATHAVFGPEETAQFIDNLLASPKSSAA